MKPTLKVTNTVSQLPIYYDKGTNKLGQITNISRNTGFAFFFKSIFLEELLKFPRPWIITFCWNRHEPKKLQILSISYQHIMIKKLTNFAKLPTYFDKGINNLSQDANMFYNTKFLFIFKAMILDELLNFQTHKQGRLVKNEANSKSYQHCQSVTNIIW